MSNIREWGRRADKVISPFRGTKCRDSNDGCIKMLSKPEQRFSAKLLHHYDVKLVRSHHSLSVSMRQCKVGSDRALLVYQWNDKGGRNTKLLNIFKRFQMR